MKASITYTLQDMAALLAIFLGAWLLIMAGTAFGIDHCERNRCAGYENSTTNQGAYND